MKLLLLVVLMFINTCAFLQSQTLTWNRLYNGPLNWYDESYGICQTTDGNYAVAGYTRSPGDVPYVIKMNTFGDTIWTLTLPAGSFAQTASCIAPAEDGGVLISGQGQRLFVAGISSVGKLEWLNSYSSNPYERGEQIIRSPDGYYFVCGQGGFVMKINRRGDLIWKRYYFGDIEDLAITKGGDIIACGTAFVSSDSVAGIIHKIDPDGNVKWRTIHNLRQTTTAVAVDVSNSEYYIGGTVRISGIIKSYVSILDSTGKIHSNTILNSESKEYLQDLMFMTEEKLVICTHLLPDSIDYINHSRILITDTNLKVKREVIFDSAQLLQLFSITVNNSGYITATGTYRYITFGGIDDIWTVRMDSNLNVPLVNIRSNQYSTPSKARMSISPNPFNSHTEILYTINESANFSLEIYDVSGRLIKSQFIGFRQPGNHRFNLDWTENSSGIYICILKSNVEIHALSKFVFLK